MAVPDLNTVLSDPKFNGLPAPEQQKVLDTVLQKDPKFLGLPPEERQKVKDRLAGQQRPSVRPQDNKENTLLGNIREFGDKTIIPTVIKFLRGDAAERDAYMNLGVKSLMTGKSAVDEERNRRMDTKGGDYSDEAMAQWRLKKAAEAVHGKAPADVAPMTMLKEQYHAAVSDPLKFGKDFLVGMAQHPELILTGPFAFALAPLESIMEQRAEKGHVDWGQVGVETGEMAIPAYIAHGAVKLGIGKQAANTKGEITPGVEQEMIERVNKKVKEGASLLTALQDEALNAIQLPEHDAKTIVGAARAATKEITAPEIKAEQSPVSAAVVRIGGKEYDAPNHFLAIKQAIADGAETEVRNGVTVPKMGKGDSINLFRLRDSGKLIDRDEAGKLTGAKRTEDMQPPIEGDKNAPEARQEQRDGQQQHTGTEAQRVLPKAGGGDSDAHGGKEPQEKEEGLTREVPMTPEMQKQADAQFKRNEAAIDSLGPKKAARHRELSKKIEDRTITDAEGKEWDKLHKEVVKFAVKQRGSANTKLLAALGITGLGGAGLALITEDPNDAIKGALVTGGVIAAGALLLRGARALGNVLRDTSYRITHLTTEHSGDIRAGMLANARFAHQIAALVKDKGQREQLTHYLQGDQSVQLTPEMQQVAIAVREFFERQGEKGQKMGILPDDLIDDYVTQLWTGMNKNDSLFNSIKQVLGNKFNTHPGMSPKSRFALERVIPSYRGGMARGMIPATLDIADIVRIYGDNMNRAIANKKLIQALAKQKHPDVFQIQNEDGSVRTYQRALIIPDTPDAIAKAIAQGAAIVDKQWQGGGAIAKDLRDWAIRHAPKDYVQINHPQMRGYKVHPDIVAPMKWLFDAKDPGMATNAMLAVSIAAKRGLFSFSLFHAKSLTESMLGQSFKSWVKVFNGEASRQLKGNLRAGEPDVLTPLVRNGLQINEAPIEGQIGPYTNMLKLLEERHPAVGVPAKGLHVIVRAMQAFTFGVVQPTFKVAAAMAMMEKTLAKNPRMGMNQAAKAAASAANDFFGGQDWFKIADEVDNKIGRHLALAVTSPAGRRFMQIAMLAPDWTVSTARTLIKAIPGVSTREINALHQAYVVRSGLMYLTFANALNYAFTGHSIFENEDWTYVDMGDGRKMQLSKHFMEMFHWLRAPGQQTLNKLGYLPREIAEQAMDKEYLSAKGSPPISNRVTHALKDFFPITGQQAFENGTVPALSGFFGVGIYGKTDEQYAEEARKNADARKEAFDEKSDKEKKGHREPVSGDVAADRALKRRERARKLREQDE